MIRTGRATALLAAGWDPQLTLLGAYLGAALLLGALVIAWGKRWRGRARSDRVSASDQLAEFRSLYETGALSQEEFDKLRAVLGGEIRHELEVPARPPAGPAGPAPPPGGEPRPPETGIRPG